MSQWNPPAIDRQLGQFYIGCAVWAYKNWVGSFYPKGSRASDFLKLYSQRFTTVEGNTTFYQVPDRPTLERWREETPAGFRFCLKLPQTITHQGHLQPQIAAARHFQSQMQVLGDRLGPFFAQLPPTYPPNAWEDLIAFLSAWPTEVPLALEVRHAAWFRDPHRDRLNDWLADRQMGRVLLDSRPIYQTEDQHQAVVQERKKPNLPLQPIVTAPFSLIRFISHPHPHANPPFLEDWVPQIDQWLHQGHHLYVFVHCPQEIHSPSNAIALQQTLEVAGVPVPPLPIVLPPATEQLRLF